MRKAISIWAFPGDWPLERSAALAKDAGFEGVELAYALEGPLGPECSAADLEGIRATFAEHGLVIPSLATGVLWQINLLSPDADERQQAKTHVRTMLHQARDLGAGCILVVPGFTGPFEAGPPVVSDYVGSYQRAVDDIRDLGQEAAKVDVQIGVENVWNRFLTGPMEMRQFIDTVDHSHVGVYFDVGNVLRNGYPQHWIQVLGERIRRVHFKDFRIAVGTLQGFVDLLEGDVDYPLVLSALEAVGYDGWVTGELFTREPYPEAVVYRASRDMDTILNGGIAC